MVRFSSLAVSTIILVQLSFAQSSKLIYDRVSPFKEGMASVYLAGKVGYVNQSGKEIVPPIYEDDFITDEFDNGLAKVKLKGGYGMIDKTGKLVVPNEYISIEPFSEGLAAANHTKRGFEFINDKGKVVLSIKYALPNVLGGVKFVNGLIPVQNGMDEFGFMDRKGTLVIPFKYHYADLFTKDGLAVIQVSFDNPKLNFINTTGKELTTPKYDNVSPFVDGMAGVNQGAKADASFNLIGGKWGLINTSGFEVRPCLYDRIVEIKSGYAIVETGKYPNVRLGVVSKTGFQVIPQVYGSVFLLDAGMLVSRTPSGPQAFFDFNGRRKTPFSFRASVSTMAEGCIAVGAVNEQTNATGKLGVMDSTGKIIIPHLYDRIEKFSDGFASVVNEGKWGVIDKTGKVIIPLEYEYIGPFKDGWAPVSLNKKMGFINKEGIIMSVQKK